MLQEEGLDKVMFRHARHGAAVRAAVHAWGLELVAEDPAEYSNTVTAVLTPEHHSADRLRQVVLDQLNMSLGTGLGKFADKLFRIGHLGWLNDLMLAGTLSGVEMGLHRAGIPHNRGGILAALSVLNEAHQRTEAAPLVS